MDELEDFLEQSPYVQKKKEESREEGREIGREIGREEGREEGREIGRKEGREEGREMGRVEGLGIGRKEGREEGIAETLQKAFVTVVQGRFPPLAELAQERVTKVTRPEKLDLLLKQIVTIPDENTARWLLNTIAA